MKPVASVCLLLCLLCGSEAEKRRPNSLEKWIRNKREAPKDQCCTLGALDVLADTLQQDLDFLLQAVFDIDFTLQEFIQLGTVEKYPAPSCHYLYYAKYATSGYYYIGKGEGITPHKVYCNMDMSGSPFGSTQGWMKVADFDMRRKGEECPPGFQLVEQQGLRLCAKKVEKGCQSIKFPLYGVPYQRLCGRASAFQLGTNNAFHRFNCDHCNTIDSPYVDGISITHDYPRRHIWSLAASWTSYNGKAYRGLCPCSRGKGTGPPDFVGGNYFCETGQYWSSKKRFDEDDPLWDGEGCDKDEKDCCEAPGLPWFCTDVEGDYYQDIEVRVCQDETKEDLYLQFLDIYVQ